MSRPRAIVAAASRSDCRPSTTSHRFVDTNRSAITAPERCTTPVATVAAALPRSTERCSAIARSATAVAGISSNPPAAARSASADAAATNSSTSRAARAPGASVIVVIELM
jgi:hypothetical protein